MRVTQQQRIATESTEEREARLQQVRSAQDRRIATESAEEREARLQQLRVAQQQRIATETSEEIEARRARDRRNHMDLKTADAQHSSSDYHGFIVSVVKINATTGLLRLHNNYFFL